MVLVEQLFSLRSSQTDAKPAQSVIQCLGRDRPERLVITTARVWVRIAQTHQAGILDLLVAPQLCNQIALSRTKRLQFLCDRVDIKQRAIRIEHHGANRHLV